MLQLWMKDFSERKAKVEEIKKDSEKKPIRTCPFRLMQMVKFTEEMKFSGNSNVQKVLSDAFVMGHGFKQMEQGSTVHVNGFIQ